MNVEQELAKALYKFSYGRLSVEQAEEKAKEVIVNFDFTNEELSHKGINWVAKEILSKI